MALLGESASSIAVITGVPVNEIEVDLGISTASTNPTANTANGLNGVVPAPAALPAASNARNASLEAETHKLSVLA